MDDHIRGGKQWQTTPKTCPGRRMPEPYRSHDWALVPASPASKAEYYWMNESYTFESFLSVGWQRTEGTIRGGKNKLINTYQHNERLLEYRGYMFRPVNRSSSGHQTNKSKVLLIALMLVVLMLVVLMLIVLMLMLIVLQINVCCADVYQWLYCILNVLKVT